MDNSRLTIIVGLFLGLATIIGPIATLQLSSWNASRALEVQHERENIRAMRLEKATQAVAAQVAKDSAEQAVARKQIDSRLADVAATTDATHVLVNSNYTASKQSERDSMARALAMMYEVVELRKALGQAPTQQALTEIEATSMRLQALDKELKERR